MTTSLPHIFYIVLGFILGLIDMFSSGPTSFRPAELVLALVIVVTSCIYAKIPKEVCLALGLTFPFLCLIESQTGSIGWFAKVLITFCMISFIQKNYKEFIYNLAYGILIGYTAFSVFLILSGSPFEAKYTAVQCAILFLIFSLSSNSAHKAIHLAAFLISVFVALLSESRGQILVLLLTFIIMFFRKRKIFSRKILPAVISMAVFLPFISIVIKLAFLRNTVLADGYGANINAGDLERTILGAYSVASLGSHLWGQSAQQISVNASELLGVFSGNELHTVSAHNIIEDSLLFGGIGGFSFIVIIGYLFRKRLLDIKKCINATDIAHLAICCIIFVFIISTSPITGLERIELLTLSLVMRRLISDKNLKTKKNENSPCN